MSWLVPQGKEGIDGVAAPAQDRQDTASGWSHLQLRNSEQAQERVEAARVDSGFWVME